MTLSILLFFILSSIIFLFLDHAGIRESILKAYISTSFLILASTEILSLMGLINYSLISYIWLISLVIVVFIAVINRDAFLKGLRNFISDHEDLQRGINPIVILSITIIGLICFVTLIIAVKSPPNNFDSMTYHMARVSHWTQNHNIRYFPTSIPRQNYSMPLAEYGILHLQLLSQGDQYANLIQWFSFLIAIITATLIAKELKISPKGQWLTAVFAAALPMAILQSSSTQNDLVVSVFCLAFVYFLSRSIQTGKWLDVLFTALSLGFALATKGTAYIFCAAAGLGIGGFTLFGKNWGQIKNLLLRYSIIILAGITLNTGIYLRNWDLYKHPLITSNERTIVEEISPKILFSSLVRNGAIHLSSPISASNQILEKGIARILGSELNNPASTFQESKFDLSFSINEDDAGNGFHLILLSISILILPWLITEHKKDLLLYLGAVVFSILLFSLVFKWQPWGGRLQTPIFLLGCAGIGYLLERVIKREWILSLILILLVFQSTPYLLLNANRPLLPLWEDSSVFYDTEWERKLYNNLEGRLDRFPALAGKVKSGLSILYEGRSVILTERKELSFLGNFEDYYWYAAACHLVRNTPSREIGLIMDSNDWEYPLWVLLRQQVSTGDRILYHIEVEDISRKISQDYPPRPGLILVTRDQYQDLEILNSYQQIYSSSSIQVYQKTN